MLQDVVGEEPIRRPYTATFAEQSDAARRQRGIVVRRSVTHSESTHTCEQVVLLDALKAPGLSSKVARYNVDECSLAWCEASGSTNENVVFILRSSLAPITYFSHSVLHLAAQKGALDCVEWLPRNGVGVDAVNIHGHTALYEAASLGHHKICKRLVKSGADFWLRTKHSQTTALYHAARSGHAKTVKTLLAYVSDFFVLDKYRRTPLHNAAVRGHASVVRAILGSMSRRESDAQQIRLYINLQDTVP